MWRAKRQADAALFQQVRAVGRVGTPKLSTRSSPMRYILGIVLIFALLAWDIAANGGHITHSITGALEDLARQLGLL
jgi:hypothetical protein